MAKFSVLIIVFFCVWYTSAERRQLHDANKIINGESNPIDNKSESQLEDLAFFNTDDNESLKFYNEIIRDWLLWHHEKNYIDSSDDDHTEDVTKYRPKRNLHSTDIKFPGGRFEFPTESTGPFYPENNNRDIRSTHEVRNSKPDANIVKDEPTRFSRSVHSTRGHHRPRNSYNMFSSVYTSRPGSGRYSRNLIEDDNVLRRRRDVRVTVGNTQVWPRPPPDYSKARTPNWNPNIKSNHFG